MNSAGHRLLLALELSELTEAILRARLVRERPGATTQEIEREVRAWRHRRPGAELGDTKGRLRKWRPKLAPSRKR